ncbi:hypothetical protein [Pseudomonas sp. RL_15y_Pfl2_60]|uniref:hypothetical protein n=1 Tax=Pseudomonas sp. RL_15y_Pfl2_60 TaxID=3088709 RepID=UPI0030D6E7AB
MSCYDIPLSKQELLHHMLQVGGKAVVHLHSPEQVIQANFEVELTETQIRCNVEIGGHCGEVKLRRSDRANHLHLRDFILDMANGDIESAAPSLPRAGGHAPKPVLSNDDEIALRHVCSKGGSKTLASGFVISVHMHKALAKAIACKDETTHFCSGSASDVYSGLAEHIELLLDAA